MRSLLVFLLLPVLLTSATEWQPEVTDADLRRLTAAQDLAATNTTAALTLLLAVPETERSAADWYLLGNLYLQGEQPEAAVTSYATAIQRFPTYRDAYLNQGFAELSLDRPCQALATLQTLLRLGAVDADLLVALGQAAQLCGNPVVAESAYRAALLQDAERSFARQALAQVLLEQERYTEAAALTRELLKQEPAEPAFWRLHANLALALGRERDAIVRLEAAERLGALDAAQYAQLGQLYLRTEQVADAQRCFQASLDADNHDRVRLQAVEGFLALDALPQAEAFLSGLSDKADARRAGRLRAELAARKGHGGEAVTALRALLREEPLNAELLRTLAQTYEELDQSEPAVEIWQRLARLPGQEAVGLVGQGLAEARRGNVAEAVRLLEASLSFDDAPEVRRYLRELQRRLDP